VDRETDAGIFLEKIELEGVRKQWGCGTLRHKRPNIEAQRPEGGVRFCGGVARAASAYLTSYAV